jgi:hypothetical protein
METTKNRVNHNQMMQRKNFLICILVNEVYHSFFTSHQLEPRKLPCASTHACSHTHTHTHTCIHFSTALFHSSYSPKSGVITLPSGTKPKASPTSTYPQFVHFNHQNNSTVYFTSIIIHVQYIRTLYICKKKLVLQ